MKKLVCLIISALILIFAFSPCVAAAGVSVTCGNEAVQKGETVQVKITFDAGKQVYAFQYLLNYDREKLELVGVSGGQSNEAQAGSVNYIAIGNGAKNTATFTFKTKKAGEAVINIVDVLAATTTEEIKFSSVSFSVKVDAPTRGDCNGDNNVDTTDLAFLKLYLAGEDAEINLLADYNQDSVIDTTDLALLKNYLSEG